MVGADGWPVEPAQSFLWHTLVESGEALSALTWEAYGRRLFDYFAFLEANGLAWNEESQADGLSVLSRYRDWSSGELELDPSAPQVPMKPSSASQKRLEVIGHCGLTSAVAPMPGASLSLAWGVPRSSSSSGSSNTAV